MNSETFNDVFWITLAGFVFGFLGMIVQTCYKSKCARFKCCGFECERAVDIESENDVRHVFSPRNSPSQTPLGPSRRDTTTVLQI